MSDEEYGADPEISENHYKLLDAVTQLDKGQRVKKPRRSEPSTKVSEFHLVKGSREGKDDIHLDDLTKTLGKRASHADIGRKVQAAQRKSLTLRKPLEKPVAAKIKRAVGFENVKEDLGRWDAIVAKNRTSDNLSFPLNQSSKILEDSNDYLKRFSMQSELEKELAALEPTVEEKVEDPEKEATLSLAEIMERRKETARLRAQQSYKEAKAHRQNKIKSKKFHRIERKQKIKQQLKDFEQLQKTDPEAALAKLELLEKSRAQERMSLRHKSTGQWAKNQQVRAKYDKESRQVLAQQLSISRELTQKIKNDDNSSSSDGEVEQDGVSRTLKNDPDNPWINNAKTDSEINDFITSYRKYWDEKNKVTSQRKDKVKSGDKTKNTETTPEICSVPQTKETLAVLNPVEKVIVEHAEHMFPEDSEAGDSKVKADIDNSSSKITKKRLPTATANSPKKKLSSPLTKKKKPVKVVATSAWEVTQTSNDVDSRTKRKSVDIDDIFDTITEKAQKEVGKKLKSLKDSQLNGHHPKRAKNAQPKSSGEYTEDLGLKGQRQRPTIDEELDETYGSNGSDAEDEIARASKMAKLDMELKQKSKEVKIDPNKFINIKPKRLKTQLPDTITGGEEGMDDSEDDKDYRNLIGEAFADDDVVEEFRKDKEKEVQQSQPQDVDLSLPGWGTWGGKNVDIPVQKKRRFILKFPKDAPRKDENKGDVIIIEEKDPKIKSHQVNELPFPFRNVNDFEASIRAPIGRNFVPENAHRRLIQPSVETKLGKVIEPMDEESLVKMEKSYKFKKSQISQKRKSKHNKTGQK